jgi:hypothetical protein
LFFGEVKIHYIKISNSQFQAPNKFQILNSKQNPNVGKKVGSWHKNKEDRRQKTEDRRQKTGKHNSKFQINLNKQISN